MDNSPHIEEHDFVLLSSALAMLETSTDFSVPWFPGHTQISIFHYWYYLPTPPLGQDMTQGQFLSGV